MPVIWGCVYSILQWIAVIYNFNRLLGKSYSINKYIWQKFNTHSWERLSKSREDIFSSPIKNIFKTPLLCTWLNGEKIENLLLIPGIWKYPFSPLLYSTVLNVLANVLREEKKYANWEGRVNIVVHRVILYRCSKRNKLFT